jgi:NAD(P)-dependent dehydrogenase (short-subunit alcohol dehydrogenase family)
MASVLITGCDSGIGYHTAECFADAGHRVFATVRSGADTARVDALAAAAGGRLTILRLDVTDPAQIAAVSESVLAEGPLDVLVNNAGRVMIAPAEESSDADARALFDVNFFGLFAMTKAFLPAMRAQRAGTIVNLSSPSALVPAHWYGLYAASKAAVGALSATLAHELAPWNIRVIVVYPGNFKTAVLKHAVGSLEVAPDSPYFELRQQTKAAARVHYAAMLGPEERATRESGRPVGEAILSAVFDGTGRLHYPVGTDAQTLFDNRAKA